MSTENYVLILKELGIKSVIRLNKPKYDSKIFEKAGIKHYELYFPDGSLPSRKIVQKFLKIVEEEPEAVGVHCRAGLGRTGTLIACYIMKHYRMPA